MEWLYIAGLLNSIQNEPECVQKLSNKPYILYGIGSHSEALTVVRRCPTMELGWQLNALLKKF